MEGREHAPETVWRAQELYCVDRQSYDQVAKEIAKEIEPVAVSTLKRWGKTYDWKAKREELAQALSEIPADTILARAKLIKALLNDPDPQMGFAVSSMESLAMKQAEAARAGRMAEATARFKLRAIRTKEDAIEAMKEAAELKLNRMLSNPSELDFKAVQDVKRSMEFIASMEANLNAGTEDEKDKTKGISLETADQIRRDILGIK